MGAGVPSSSEAALPTCWVGAYPTWSVGDEYATVLPSPVIRIPALPFPSLACLTSSGASIFLRIWKRGIVIHVGIT